MLLDEVYTRVRPSIVAFCSKIAKGHDGGPPLIAPIIGTGFVVHEAGIIATNRHVAEAILQLPKHPTRGLLAFAMVFGEVQQEEGGFGMNAQFVDLVQLQMVSEFHTTNEYFYGEKIPDVAVVQLAVRGLPALSLATEEWSIRVGMEVATAGFPLGEDPLIVHGFVGQGVPLLRRGIVSAVNPFPCPHPDAFTIDIMTQGGASGSPIFRTDSGDVLGILYGGFPGTNVTFAVPSLIVSSALETFMNEHFDSDTPFPTLAELAHSKKAIAEGESPWEAVS